LEEKLSVDIFYSNARETGKILGLECESGHLTVPPRHSCRICGSKNLSVKEVKAEGILISFTKVFSKSGEFPIPSPYILGLVRLNEGGNLIGVISGDEKLTPHNGAKVRVRFDSVPDGTEWPRIFFEISQSR
jgi:uncharacterized OB-fold protein